MASILMVASENGLLPDCKVGGIADVVSELSVSLASQGHNVTVLTPGYGLYSKPTTAKDQIEVQFRGQQEHGDFVLADLIQGVTCRVVEHPLIQAEQPGQIYVHDLNEPFATDSSRFALFSIFAAEWALQTGGFDVIHLHDWHAANVAILRCYSTRYASLKDTTFVYTIHNLALQGVRPLNNNSASIQAWFPDLEYDDRIVDPRWRDCVNLMRAGILLTDRVNTVSETYALEIQHPNDASKGRHGGEGLEKDLKQLATEGRLSGILNGCDYGPALEPRLNSSRLLTAIRQFLRDQASTKELVPGGYLTALDNIAQLDQSAERFVVTSIGRAVPQKMGLLLVEIDGKTVFDRLIESAPANTLFVILASGDSTIEQFLVQRAERHTNFIYIPGFSAKLADLLYRSGDLFIMPSLFEPCGLSQLLAMRNGQPCIVNDVGGLRDTVDHGRTGWKFTGDSLQELAENFTKVFSTVCTAGNQKKPAYLGVVKSAKQARFTWAAAARKYQQLYGIT